MSLQSHHNRYRANESDEANLDEWLGTYSDMITLILCFFVLMVGISKIDPLLFEQVKKGLRSEIAKEKEVKTPLAEIKHDLDSLLFQEKQDRRVSISLSPKGIILEFASSSFYEPGTAVLGKSSHEMISKVIHSVKNITYYPFSIDIEGHTDNVPIHTPLYPSNWELSVNRATNLVKTMIDSGITPDRLKAAGYADTKPKLPNTDSLGQNLPSNQAVNRRVVVRIY